MININEVAVMILMCQSMTLQRCIKIAWHDLKTFLLYKSVFKIHLTQGKYTLCCYFCYIHHNVDVWNFVSKSIWDLINQWSLRAYFGTQSIIIVIFICLFYLLRHGYIMASEDSLQLQDDTRNIYVLGYGAPYVRGLMALLVSVGTKYQENIWIL